MFPNVSGSNLLRNKVNLPADFAGEFNLVFVPFYQWQQDEVDTWSLLANALEKEIPGFVFYELPTIQTRNVFSQFFINEGMRAGIPNAKLRERTITLYVDVPAFREEVGMPDEDHIYILLVDNSGNILWRERGEITPEKEIDLREMLVRHLGVTASNEYHLSPNVI